MRTKKGFILLILRIICFVVYLLNLPFSRLKNRNKVCILVYHSIFLGNAGADEWRIPVSLFVSHMNYLSKKGFNVLAVDETVKILKGNGLLPPKAVCITFDDGFRNNYTLAYPVLMEYGFTATFYLATAFIDQDMSFPWLKQRDYNLPLKWEDVSIMAASGMMFGSHTHTHPKMKDLDRETLQHEIDLSGEILKARLPSVSNTFVCPFGMVGKIQEVLRLVLERSKYEAAFLGSFGTAHTGSNFYNLPRITIYGDDSLTVFKQKLAGAYDWIGPLHAIWRYVMEVLRKSKRRTY